MRFEERLRRLEKSFARDDDRDQPLIVMAVMYKWPEDAAEVAEELKECPGKLSWGEDDCNEVEVTDLDEVAAALGDYTGLVAIGPTNNQRRAAKEAGRAVVSWRERRDTP